MVDQTAAMESAALEQQITVVVAGDASEAVPSSLVTGQIGLVCASEVGRRTAAVRVGHRIVAGEAAT